MIIGWIVSLLQFMRLEMNNVNNWHFDNNAISKNIDSLPTTYEHPAVAPEILIPQCILILFYVCSLLNDAVNAEWSPSCINDTQCECQWERVLLEIPLLTPLDMPVDDSNCIRQSVISSGHHRTSSTKSFGNDIVMLYAIK